MDDCRLFRAVDFFQFFFTTSRFNHVSSVFWLKTEIGTGQEKKKEESGYRKRKKNESYSQLFLCIKSRTMSIISVKQQQHQQQQSIYELNWIELNKLIRFGNAGNWNSIATTERQSISHWFLVSLCIYYFFYLLLLLLLLCVLRFFLSFLFLSFSLSLQFR